MTLALDSVAVCGLTTRWFFTSHIHYLLKEGLQCSHVYDTKSNNVGYISKTYFRKNDWNNMISKYFEKQQAFCSYTHSLYVVSLSFVIKKDDFFYLARNLKLKNDNEQLNRFQQILQTYVFYKYILTYLILEVDR